MSFQFLVSGFLTAICAATLCGMPDPDLFDGRYSSAPSDTSATGDEMNQSGKLSEGNGDAGDRDESASEVSADEGARVTAGKSGSGKPGSSSSSSESTISEAGSIRSFEEFEIGSVDKTNGQIEIKRSKELGEPSSSASQSSNQAANSDSQSSDENAQKSSVGNQETFDGSGSVDYGKDVPFGL